MNKRLSKLLSVECWKHQYVWYRMKILRPFYQKYILPRKLKKIKNKQIINVLFVLHDLGSWKTESLYKEMMQHGRFKVNLLLVSEEKNSYSFEIMKKYLDVNEYPYDIITPQVSIKNKYSPDIIFYQKPYLGIINWHYFFANNLSAVFCYVIYSFRNRNSPHLRNVIFFDYVWQLYAENDKVIDEMHDVLYTKGKNMVNTGLPIMDELLLDKKYFKNPWKAISGNRKRIIYAPHHTVSTDVVESGSPFDYSTFLEYADFFLEMAEKYENKVQWAFKPHPLLRSKLNNIWGKEKTDRYYERWTQIENCQLSEGDYLGLFKYSDAMIHDCGSFKLEYLYTHNPVMYLVNGGQIEDFQNWQTTKALELHYHGKSRSDIEKFIQSVIEGKDVLENERRQFVERYLTPPHGKSACENIINSILGEKEYA